MTPAARAQRTLRLCDGRLPRELRAPRATYESVARRLWDHGLPGASTRHAATFLLALSCRWQRLARDEAEARVVAWFRERRWVRSREWRASPRRAEVKTRRIVRYTYRERAPRPRRSRARYERPGTVSLADQAALEHLFPRDPLAIEVALRVLCFARSNSRLFAGGRVVCDLPLRELGVTTRRRRAAWQRVQDTGRVFRLYAARVGLRGADHALGPRAARAARYTILWRFEERGPRIRRRARLSFRRVSYLASAACLSSRSANTIRRPLGPLSCREGSPAEMRPVGAVHAVARVPAAGVEDDVAREDPVGVRDERVLRPQLRLLALRLSRSTQYSFFG